VIIKNFLTREECQILLEEAEVSNSWRPQHADTGIYILPSKNHKIMIDINKRVSELFDKNLYVQMIRMIHRTDKDSFWEEHSDNSGSPNTHYGVVIYLNDNFEGGELLYTDSNTKIKPEVGMLICHPGDRVHKVLDVISGNRYTLTSFITSKTDLAKTPGVSV
jgi:hypothetical protein